MSENTYRDPEILAAEFGGPSLAPCELTYLHTDQGSFEVDHGRDGELIVYDPGGFQVRDMVVTVTYSLEKPEALLIHPSVEAVRTNEWGEGKRPGPHSPDDLRAAGWTVVVADPSQPAWPVWLTWRALTVSEVSPVYCTRCACYMRDDDLCRHLFVADQPIIEELCGIGMDIVGSGVRWSPDTEISLAEVERVFKEAVRRGAARVKMTVTDASLAVLRCLEHGRRNSFKRATEGIHTQELTESIYRYRGQAGSPHLAESVHFPFNGRWEADGFVSEWINSIDSDDLLACALTCRWLVELMGEGGDDVGAHVADLAAQLAATATRYDDVVSRLAKLDRAHVELARATEPMRAELRALRGRQTRVWAAACLTRPDDGCVLLRRRAQGTVDEGLYGPPGGHVEPGESMEDALARELLEETGLVLVSATLLHVLHRHDEPESSGVVLLYEVEWAGDYLRREDGHEPWEWVDPRSLEEGQVQSGLGRWFGLGGPGDVVVRSPLVITPHGVSLTELEHGALSSIRRAMKTADTATLSQSVASDAGWSALMKLFEFYGVED